ncbi:MAG: molybdopterin converting factor subunit 1 [Rhodospirillaceae bacterium]|jgi:molybdopterin synthase sulfur carrier subunit|nr:molybdopterin converting factor subunit 1 [Rhodospirillaceae bacterium]MBT5374639.1 molybdopterin converting factor subunit 1 [Rhodospirillaceae bacterium]MBT5660312.1 molybdopterin converting factor subunit 1 [Rhodospirillaceae bacterium]MBT5751986.1 molybdopterin converting factor subunit 1 [Rhodospirillaceae bacterium]
MKILYFAWLRSTIGLAQETATPPSDITNVSDLIDWLRELSPAHTKALSDISAVRVAVNQSFASLDYPLASDDEVALFPPVTGG